MFAWRTVKHSLFRKDYSLKTLQLGSFRKLYEVTEYEIEILTLFVAFVVF